jgi:hypothetical protein
MQTGGLTNRQQLHDFIEPWEKALATPPYLRLEFNVSAFNLSEPNTEQHGADNIKEALKIPL